MNQMRLLKKGGFVLCLTLLLVLSLSLLTDTCFAKYNRTFVLKGTVKYTPAVPAAPAVVSGSVDETDYTVTNTGDADALIRVTVELEMTDESAEPFSGIPVGEGWTQLMQDEVAYLYYNGAVAPGEKTVPAIDLTELSDPSAVLVTLHAEAVSADEAGREWGATFNGESWTADISD